MRNSDGIEASDDHAKAKLFLKKDYSFTRFNPQFELQLSPNNEYHDPVSELDQAKN